MVEIFKTNVRNKLNAKAIIEKLELKLPGAAINFDLEDCDKILRIENEQINSEIVLGTLEEQGFSGNVLQ